MTSYVTTGPWGAGLGRVLEADEVDLNFYGYEQRITALETDRPQPNNIVSVALVGTNFVFTFVDSSTLSVPASVVSYLGRFRHSWLPFTGYTAVDIVTAEGFGLYIVNIDHTSEATFDPDRMIDSAPVYTLMFGTEVGSGAIYDLEFYYQGQLAASASDLVSFISLRTILIPALGDQHKAYLLTPATVEVQELPLLRDGVQIGTITFAVGENVGTVVVDADEAILAGQRLSVGIPVTPDATAAGLTIALAGQRVV